MRAILYSPENSTNVRFVSPEAPDVTGDAPPHRAPMPVPMRLRGRSPSPWLRAAFRVAGAIAPPLAVRWAERPPVPSPSTAAFPCAAPSSWRRSRASPT